MAKKKLAPTFLHVGAAPMPDEFIEKLKPDYRYFFNTDDDFEPNPDHPLFNPETGRFDFRYSLGLVLIDKTCPWLNEPEKLAAMQSGQVIIEKGLYEVTSPEATRILKLKNATEFDLNDIDFLVHDLKLYFFGGQDGGALSYHDVTVSPSFKGSYRMVGRAFRELEGDFGEEWQNVAFMEEQPWIPPHMGDTLYFEFETFDDAELMVRCELYDPQTYTHQKTLELSGEDLKQKVFDIAGEKTGWYVQINYYARGTGRVRLGTAHLRRSRGKYGEFFVGGSRVVSKSGMNDAVDVYFDAGDMKPPLNVYFSGYRSKESFEGNWIMRGMHSPFILISDNRLEGGCFYMGSDSLEEGVTAYIQDALDRLGFTNDDLILAGLSMGTFGALYYAAKTKPHAVVIGKPLVNVGNIAKNIRLDRPGDWPTSLDMVAYLEGELSQGAIDRVNEHFWRTFRAGDMSMTKFVIAYMLQDDYDHDGFTAVRDYLKERYQTVPILSKGFIGRHNDDTAGVVSYFLSEYQHILTEDFGR